MPPPLGLIPEAEPSPSFQDRFSLIADTNKDSFHTNKVSVLMLATRTGKVWASLTPGVSLRDSDGFKSGLNVKLGCVGITLRLL
jgi:hypothetical protein